MADAAGGSSTAITGHARWADAWTRAVVLPAARRASAIWVGCAIAAAIVFGPTGMHPSDLTGLALGDPAAGAVLALTWVLVFAPTARLLARAEPAAYLRSLPGPRLAPLLIGGGAFVVLQLPWLALWVIGEGARGLAAVAATSLVALALAAWRPPPGRAGWPAWRSGPAALRAIHLRALRRRAGDALVRGAGLAVLAGVVAGLFVRNNRLEGPEAAAIGGAAAAVALVPAHAGALLVTLGAHRQSGWLADSLGLSPGARAGAVVFAIGAVQGGASVIALAAAAIVAAPSAATLAWLALAVLGVALGSSLGCARVLLVQEESPQVAARAVTGALAMAAAAVLCLGLFGVAGVAALVAAGLFGFLGVRA